MTFAAFLEAWRSHLLRQFEWILTWAAGFTGWTLGGAIQPHVDIYLSQETYEAVKVAFPYLVSKEFASGGGDVSHSCRYFLMFVLAHRKCPRCRSSDGTPMLPTGSLSSSETLASQ